MSLPVNEIERITRLETQHEEIMRLMQKAIGDLEEIKSTTTKWKGIALGIIIAVSTVWTVAYGIISWFKSH